MTNNYPTGVDSTDIDRHFGNSDTRIEDGTCLHPCFLCDALAVPHELPERGESGGGCAAFERKRRSIAAHAEYYEMATYEAAYLFDPNCADFLNDFGYTLGGFEA